MGGALRRCGPPNRFRTGFHAARTPPPVRFRYHAGFQHLRPPGLGTGCKRGAVTWSWSGSYDQVAFNQVAGGWLASGSVSIPAGAGWPWHPERCAFGYVRLAGCWLACSDPERQPLAAKPRGSFGFVSEPERGRGVAVRPPPLRRFICHTTPTSYIRNSILGTAFLPGGRGFVLPRPRGNFLPFRGNIFPPGVGAFPGGSGGYTPVLQVINFVYSYVSPLNSESVRLVCILYPN